MDLLACLSAPLARGPYADLAAWRAAFALAPAGGHVTRAFWGGMQADRLGYAFAAGYEEALARLLEARGVAPGGTHAFAATESGGAHPRAIQARLDDALLLHGEKTFVTLATVVDAFLVVATRGTDADGRRRLVVVRVPRGAAGVEVTPRPPPPFAPEIPHAFVRLDRVRARAADVLPGDGYAAWLKPFRTIEDVHVLAAALGYLAGLARTSGWDDALAEVVALGLALADLGGRDALSPEVHVALHGLFAAGRRLAASLPWSAAPAEERARWERDAPLLLVAEAARVKRTEAARRALGLHLAAAMQSRLPP